MLRYFGMYVCTPLIVRILASLRTIQEVAKTYYTTDNAHQVGSKLKAPELQFVEVLRERKVGLISKPTDLCLPGCSAWSSLPGISNGRTNATSSYVPICGEHVLKHDFHLGMN